MTNHSSLERWNGYINSLCWEHGFLDESSWFAFLRAASLGVDGQTALSSVSDRILAADAPLKGHKVRCQLARAYAHANAEAPPRDLGGVPRPHPDRAGCNPQSQYDPAKLAGLSDRFPEPVDWEPYLEARSAFSCWNRS